MKEKYFVIDFSLFNIHTQKEKKRILIQVTQAVGVAKKFGVKNYLVFTGVNKKTFEALEKVNLKQECYYSLKAFLTQKNLLDKKIIVFDPQAEKEFEQKDKNAEVFVIGGIVDKTKDSFKTTKNLCNFFEQEKIKFERRKICLRGDVVGVPDRINLFLEIILKVILKNEEIEKAIKEVQPRIVAKWRLRKEMKKYVKKIGNKRVVSMKVFDELKKWLNITEIDFKEVAKEQKIEIIY